MSEPTVITDAKGRKLVLRPLRVLDQVRLLRAMGPEQSGNAPYVNIVQAAAGVSEVDGVPLPFPRDERMIDAAIDRLGDDGMMAVALHHKSLMDAVLAAAEAAAEGDAARPLVPPAA
jgi:hypothetical protein